LTMLMVVVVVRHARVMVLVVVGSRKEYRVQLGVVQHVGGEM
jgi:hypothetical protein